MKWSLCCLILLSYSVFFTSYVLSFKPRCKGSEEIYECYGDIEQVPNNLTSDLQIMSLISTRIKRINHADFERYPNLVTLNLTDCMLGTFERNTFDSLTRLEILDLTFNVLGPYNKFYPNLCPPQLSKLYLANNYMTNEIFQHLNCSRLRHLDLSKNLIKRISVDDIAPLCSLEKLDLSGNALKFDSECDCQFFTNWLEVFHIEAKGNFTCNQAIDCSNATISAKTINLREECLNANQGFNII